MNEVEKIEKELQKAREIISEQEKELERLRQSERALADANIRIAELYEETESMYEELVESRSIANLYAELTELNKKIQEQNGDLLKSLRHAYKIQTAALKDFNIFGRLFPDSLIYLQPRDIVSGDFYFSTYKDGKIFIAAADCTGHGVPAAFTSLLGFFYLHQIINNEGITDPAEVLTRLHKGICQTFNEEDHIHRDGMDIALCAIDKKNKEVRFAGAKRPLVYFSNGEMREIKGTAKSIGSSDHYFKKHYETTVLNLGSDDVAENSVFYIFSDGFPDLYGGTERGKYGIKRFRELLNEIHQDTFVLQKDLIRNEFYHWKKDNNAADDVLVIGFRVF